MQNLADALCVTNTPTTVKDTRDDHTYMVQRLADGNCWMLDNLALDIADSDVQGKMTSSTTNASDAQLGYLKNGGVSYPNTYFAVSKAWNNSNYYDRPLINTDYINTVPAPTYGTASNKVGVYYNYCAASAGTYCYSSSSSSGNATADVCPAGWRLPTWSEFLGITDYSSAFSPVLSGYYGSGPPGDGGLRGDWWSATANGSKCRILCRKSHKIRGICVKNYTFSAFCGKMGVVNLRKGTRCIEIS